MFYKSTTTQSIATTTAATTAFFAATYGVLYNVNIFRNCHSPSNHTVAVSSAKSDAARQATASFAANFAAAVAFAAAAEATESAVPAAADVCQRSPAYVPNLPRSSGFEDVSLYLPFFTYRVANHCVCELHRARCCAFRVKSCTLTFRFFVCQILQIRIPPSCPFLSRSV